MATGRLPDPNTAPVTAKGDLYTYSTVPAKLAVGNNGETLVADSSASTGLRWQPTSAAGRNIIINGGMDIFQRSSYVSRNAYALDRWYINSSANVTVTQSSAVTTPNSRYMMLMVASGTQQIFAWQAIETLNAQQFAGKRVVLSGYGAGLSTTTNLNMALEHSSNVDNSVTGTWTGITPVSGGNLTLSGTATRFYAVFDVPSTAKSLRVQFVNNAANITSGQGIYLGDVQLELGSVPTEFSRAGGTIAGELAACQRYYWRTTAKSAYFYSGFSYDSTIFFSQVVFPVIMRTDTPTLQTTGTAGDYRVLQGGTFINSSAVPTLETSLNSVATVRYTASSGYTQGWGGAGSGITANAYLAFSAEL